MNRYEQTTIWQKNLGKQLEPDPYQKQRDFLRVEFENFREMAKILAGEIAHVLPEFTVHDIDHIDALWETAEMVAKDDFELTPAEAFVLGGTFLIHDLGMGLASFPNGIEELKKEPIWNDTVSSLLRKKLGRDIAEVDFVDVDKEITKIATENVLRLLHAKHAEKLALISWKDNDDKNVFLIENTQLREAYGSIIGLIAHSHWWPVEELEIRLPKILGAPGIFPADWSIDPIKLACVLRIADAIQIDDRRAPSFLRTIRKPASYSDSHWNFQQKLYQPRLERNRLVFTSKSPFSISEVESWWLCYDTLLMIDNELKDVDSLLVDTNRQRLKPIGVASIEAPKRLSKLITVEGWQPVDTKIKVSNVAKLVGSLGGKQLYGDNAVVPLRELIQNASDAIRARRLLENESYDFGTITIKLGRDEIGQFIEVEDNGIGMSQKVLTGPFIDFGQSFWGTSLMHEELPGLEARGFYSTGQYGVGFFSVFMWGERVEVCTKRFENGRDSSLILEFNKGAYSRPILRKASVDEVIKDGGTRVRVWFPNSRILDSLLERHPLKRGRISIAELIETLCPSIDCNVYLEENSLKKQLIKANDWITIEPLDLMKRVAGISYFNELIKSEKRQLEVLSLNTSLISDEFGTVTGRLFLYKDDRRKKDDRFSIEGIVTVGGMRTSGLTGLIGILVGKSARASRDIGIPVISQKNLATWATNQGKALDKLNIKSDIQIECASLIRSLRGNTGNLKFVHNKSGALNYQQLIDLIKHSSCSEFILVHDAAISNYERDNNSKIKFYDNVLSVQMGVPGVLQTRSLDHHIWWPNYDEQWFHSRSLYGLVMSTFSQVWQCTVEELISISDISSDEENFEATVGKANRLEVSLDHLNIIRRPDRRPSGLNPIK